MLSILFSENRAKWVGFEKGSGRKAFLQRNKIARFERTFLCVVSIKRDKFLHFPLNPFCIRGSKGHFFPSHTNFNLAQFTYPNFRRNFRKIEWLVFQSPLVRIFLEILNIMVFFELNERTNIFFQLSNLIGITSLFIGSYGSYMIIPAGSVGLWS